MPVTTELSTPAVRRLVRAAALAPAFLLTVVAAPALAAPPEQWETAEEVSVFSMLLVILIIPAALFGLIWLLASLPSMIRGDRYTPGLAWRNENQWFGGPKEGVEAADKVDPEALEKSEETRGGASARW